MAVQIGLERPRCWRHWCPPATWLRGWRQKLLNLKHAFATGQQLVNCQSRYELPKQLLSASHVTRMLRNGGTFEPAQGVTVTGPLNQRSGAIVCRASWMCESVIKKSSLFLRDLSNEMQMSERNNEAEFRCLVIRFHYRLCLNHGTTIHRNYSTIVSNRDGRNPLHMSPGHVFVWSHVRDWAIKFRGLESLSQRTRTRICVNQLNQLHTFGCTHNCRQQWIARGATEPHTQ